MKGLCLGFLAVFALSACHGSSSFAPSAPTPGAVNLNSMVGSWSGASSDSSGGERMTWSIAENGTALGGTMNVSDATRGMMGTGTLRGTVNGRTASFHVDVAAGGFSGTMSSCTMTLDGQATMSDDGKTLTGTYGGTMSGMMSSANGMMNQPCGGAMSNGQFTLTR